MRIAVCGLGSMGVAFARRALDTGHDVTVWNRSAGKADDLVAAGAAVADTPAEAASGVEVALVVVTDDDAARGVCLGEGAGVGPDEAVVAGLDTGVLANVSTVSPGAARRIAEQGPGGRVLDTPILGAPGAIREGKGRFLVGGPPDALERARPLFDDLAADTVHCGPAGSGATLKLACNLLLVSGVTALAEAIEVARGQGIDDGRIVAALDGSLVMSPAQRLRLDAVLDPAHPGWFGPRLARKDVRLAAALADEAGIDARIAAATIAALDRVADGDWDDFAAVIEGTRG